MTRSLLLFFLLTLSAVTGLQAQFDVDYEAPRSFTIGGFDVQGCVATSKNSVIMASGLRIGDRVTVPGPQMADAMKKLWDQGAFADVTISVDRIMDENIFLKIVVEERPRLESFSFSGISKSQADELREKLRFVRGTMWTPEKQQRAERTIRNYMMEKGYYNTTVNFQQQTDSAGSPTPNFRFAVNKGEKMKIGSIKIDGNQDFSDIRLQRKMKTVKEFRWWRFWGGAKYLQKKYDESKTNLLTFYRENGYRDAEIVFDTVYMADSKFLDIDIQVFEGNQFFIRNIAFIGNYKYSSDSLRSVLGIEKGDVYDSELLDRRLHGDASGRDVSGMYLDDGYLFFNVDPVEVAVSNDSVDLEIRMFEGPQATISGVFVEGNTKTSDYVIMREVRTLPGQKFSRTDLIRSQREILNLGYFNQETMQVIPMPDPVKGTVDIKYIVEEKPSDQLQVQGGYGGRIRDVNGNTIGGGLVATLQLGFNNFSTRRFFDKKAWTPIPSGDGQKLNIAVQLNGMNWQNYSISFLEPWLGGKKPNSLGASVFYTINQSPSTGFKMKTVGGGIDYSIRLKWPDDFFRAFTSINYKYYDINNGSSAFATFGFGDAFINIFSGRLALDRTSIDAPIYPRSGSTFNFSVEGTPPYSLFKKDVDYSEIDQAEKFKFLEYHKWRFSSTWYFQIAKNLVIKPKIQYGFLGAYNSDYGISPFERFYLGGSGLGTYNFYGWEYVGLRGYPDNQIGPRAESGSSASTTIGGNIYNKYTMELRYPITLNQAAPIWVVGFAEAGNSWLGVENYNPFDLKRSAGAGIRVMLPMVGLLGVDWGWGFDEVAPGLGRHGSQFTFLIGQEF